MENNHILYGGDYNPEQWLDTPEILEQDLEYMKLANINTITLGMFSWSTLEPQEGVFNFQWLETIINRLVDQGISIILASPSGARPKWLSDKYPEVLRVSELRVRYLFGGRHNHCYTSPVYREKIQIINSALAKRFGKHPGVILWHLSNEYGGECYCPLCEKAFQEWLKLRYSSITELNRLWNTTFWSHTYSSFQQIEAPSPIGENLVHGLNLDWKRFVTDQTVDFIKWEIKALKSTGSTIPTTTNLMYNFAGLNYDKVAEVIDIVSWDIYPLWHKGEDIHISWDNQLQHDYMRSLKQQPFLLMESSPSSTNWQGVSKLKRPNLLTAASLQSIAHGSDSVLYFQIRQSRGSSEKFHGAVIDHYGGSDTRVFKEVSKLGEILSHLSDITGTNTPASVAMIYDTENRWALEDSQGPRNKGLYYKEASLKPYQALRKQGVNVDVISASQDLSKYKVIVAPMLYLFRDGIEDKIKDFVDKGGRFIMTYWSGIVDEYDRCYLGGTPYNLMDVFGLRRTETDGLYDGEVNYFIPNPDYTSDTFSKNLPDRESTGLDNSYQCRHICDLLELSTATPLFNYQREFYADTPAVTLNHYGKGVAYYIGSDPEQDFYDDFYSLILQEAQIPPLVKGIIPEGITISSRCSDNKEYVFIQNYKNEAVDISSLEIDGELILGESQNTLNAYETTIYWKTLIL
jgi:beta-galactosidase